VKHYDVSRDDGMVFDREGSVWVFNEVSEAWDYISDPGSTSGWDSREYLPQEYEPYIRVNDAAQATILKGLLA